MSIDVIWDNDEQTIIRVVFPEEWTWDEFVMVDMIIGKMLDTINHKVCYIVDIRQTKRAPTGIHLETVRTVLDFKHKNSDLLVIVGMNNVVKTLFNVVVLALGKVRTRIEIVDTMEEGYERINYRLLEIKRYGG